MFNTRSPPKVTVKSFPEITHGAVLAFTHAWFIVTDDVILVDAEKSFPLNNNERKKSTKYLEVHILGKCI